MADDPCDKCGAGTGTLKELVERVRRLESRQEKELVPTMNEHEERLDAHDEAIGQLKGALERVNSTVDRLVDSSTSTGLAVARIEKGISKLLAKFEVAA